MRRNTSKNWKKSKIEKLEKFLLRYCMYVHIKIISAAIFCLLNEVFLFPIYFMYVWMYVQFVEDLQFMYVHIYVCIYNS